MVNIGFMFRCPTMIFRISCVGLACQVTLGQAYSAEKTMPIHFVGDWCYQEEQDKTTTYALPSWIEGGHCTKILSINEYRFYGQGSHCEPLNISLKKDVAPSGTAYIAQITARCQPDGPVTAGKIQTYELSRYKGRLSVTAK